MHKCASFSLCLLINNSSKYNPPPPTLPEDRDHLLPALPLERLLLDFRGRHRYHHGPAARRSDLSGSWTSRSLVLPILKQHWYYKHTSAGFIYKAIGWMLITWKHSDFGGAQELHRSTLWTWSLCQANGPEFWKSPLIFLLCFQGFHLALGSRDFDPKSPFLPSFRTW